MFEFNIKWLCFVAFRFSLCQRFQFKASNQITLPFRVLDQLAKAKAEKEGRQGEEEEKRKDTYFSHPTNFCKFNARALE